MGVFETNSSSTHSLCICKKDEFEKWKNGELRYDRWKDKFITGCELSDEAKEDAAKQYNRDKKIFWKEWDDLLESEKNEYYKQYASKNHLFDDDSETYDEFMDSDYLESYVENYTSEHGDEIVVFGKYGYDG